jgi:hypothetical protein
MPVKSVRQESAEQGTDAAAARADEAIDAHRLGAIAGRREKIHDQ